MAMVMGLAPVVGIPLPFISFGSTAQMTFMICLGILMSIDRAKSANFTLVGKKRRISGLQFAAAMLTRALPERGGAFQRADQPPRIWTHSSVGRAADS
jgi:hypothetical protein